MKLLVVSRTMRRGSGVGRVVSLLTREWARDHEVSLAIFEAETDLYPFGGRLEILDSPYHRRGFFRTLRSFFQSVRFLIRLIVGRRPDRIIAFAQCASVPAAAAALLTGNRSRLVLSVRTDPDRIAPWGQRLIPLLYSIPERIVAVSRGVAGRLEGKGVPAGRISIIFNPVEPPSERNPTLPLEAMPARFIMGVGRLVVQKRFDHLLRAFAMLDDPTLHLVLLGDGVKRPVLESMAARLGVADRLRMPGVVHNLTPWYDKALCFVLSSAWEGWPNALMEAMLNGCPAIAYDCPYGPSEISENGHNAILIPDGDVEALSEAIALLVADPDMRRRYAEKGKIRAETFLSSRVADQWLL